MKYGQVAKKGDAKRGSADVDSSGWTLKLDREGTIVACSDVCRWFLDNAPEVLVGQPLETFPELSHLSHLIRNHFSFRRLPVVLAGRRLLADYGPGGGRKEDWHLAFVPAPAVPGGFAEIREFLEAIDPANDLSRDGMIVVDRAGIILLVNQNFADILGQKAWEMVGRHVHETYPNSNLSLLPRVMETGKAEVGEPQVLNERHVIASRWPLVKNGKTIGALGKIAVREGRDGLRPEGSPPGPPGRTGLIGAEGTEANYASADIIGHSPAIKSLKTKLLRIAARPSAVLLTGESGTGKELFAHAIHAASPRRKGPFIRVNCAAIPEHLLESELFGYVEGAFTGAKRGGQVGKFEKAHGGTIFLDEISDMSVAMQAKLLRVLQEKEVIPLGSCNIRRVDFRVIAATNADLGALVKDNRFRPDLFYRLNVVTFTIPALRERPEDIYVLAKHFIDQFNSEFGLSVQGLETQAWAALRSYPFPGNVRELRSAIESAFNLVEGAFVRLEDLPNSVLPGTGVAGRSGGAGVAAGSHPSEERLGKQPLMEIMEELEKSLIEKALVMVEGNKLSAANLLGISRPGLYKKLQKYRLH